MFAQFILSFILGFVVGSVFSRHKVGKRSTLHVINVRIFKFIIHFNHGHLGILAIVLLVLSGYYNSMVYGLLAGFAMQGFTMKDLYAKR